MKRTVLIIIAVCLAGLFAWLAINRTVLSLSTETRKSARTVIPRRIIRRTPIREWRNLPPSTTKRSSSRS